MYLGNKFRCQLTLLLFNCFMPAPANAGDSTIVARKYMPEQLKNDFLLLRRALEETHPALYRFNSVFTMDSLFDAVYRRLDHAMTEPEFFRLVAPVCGQVRCGHTRLYTSDAYKDYFFKEAGVFPFNVKIIDRQLLVSRNLSADSTIKNGTEILEINGKPAASVISMLLPMAFSDGHNQTMRPKVIEEAFVLYYNLAFGENKTFRIETLDAVSGEKKTSVVPAVPFTKDRFRRPRPAEFKLNGETALLILRTFEEPRLKRAGIDYEQFIDSAFDVIRKQKIKHLVLDLRNNKGGDPLYAAYLFAYLAEKPFGLLKYPEFKTREALSFLGDEADSSNYNLYYRKKLIQNDNGTFTWDDRNNNWYGTFEPRAENYSGKVYVLMDGASFSTTGFFGSLIKYYKRGLIIGEESGGANVCNDCHGDLLLPNTHIRVEVPRCTVTVNLDGLKYNGHGIIPDHRISETAADIFSEKDSVLEYTLSLIREKK